MKIFVDKNAEVVVNLYTYYDKDKLFFWTKNKQSGKPEGIDETSPSVKCFTLTFRLPNYRDTVEWVDSGVQFSVDGGMKISSGAVSFGRFSRLLKSWDFKDDDGAIVPATVENIGHLEPSIAKCIVEDLEQQIPF